MTIDHTAETTWNSPDNSTYISPFKPESRRRTSLQTQQQLIINRTQVGGRGGSRNSVNMHERQPFGSLTNGQQNLFRSLGSMGGDIFVAGKKQQQPPGGTIGQSQSHSILLKLAAQQQQTSAASYAITTKQGLLNS